MMPLDFDGSELRCYRQSISWLCLALTVPLSLGGPLTSEPCGPPPTERKMVFSAKAFHHDITPSDIQCFDLCWTVVSCHAASYNTDSQLCRLFAANDVSKATFLDSDLELYAVMTRAVCKPFDDPCMARMCDEGTKCQPMGDKERICIKLDAKPMEDTCPVISLPSDARVSYMGNTPGTSATINCPVNMAYTGSENITCTDNASWDQPPGRCVFFVWKDLPDPWMQAIPHGSLVHGRCLEVIGHPRPPKWFGLSLLAGSSQSCVLRLQAQGGSWTINSRFGTAKWGTPELSFKKRPFKPNGPVNLTICFGETFMLYGQGDLFATYGQRMNPDSITDISLEDLDLEQVIIRATSHTSLAAPANLAGTAKGMASQVGKRAAAQWTSSGKALITGQSLGKQAGSKEEKHLNQDSPTGKAREGGSSTSDGDGHDAKGNFNADYNLDHAHLAA